MLEKVFKLSAHGTTVRTELLAGLTTFLTMAYIIVVNPDILSAAGMDKGALFVATCVAAAIGCFIMGFVANYPIALAPGLGLNAFFAFGVVGAAGVGWQTALGVIFVSGVLFLILSVLPVRTWIINAIPRSLKMAISAGIGLFIGVIALEIAGISVQGDPAPLITLGEITTIEFALVAVGFVAIVALDRMAVPGTIFLGIVGTTALAHLLGVAGDTALDFTIPSLAPTLFQLDIAGACQLGLLSVIIAFLFADLFDTAGTLIGGIAPRRTLGRAGASAASAPGAYGRQRRNGHGCPARDLDRYELYRKRGRGAGRWADRAYGGRGRGFLYRRAGAGPGHRADAALCDRPGLAVCRGDHGARPNRDRLGRCDRVRAGRAHRTHYAVYLLHRARHRLWLCGLCRGQGPVGTRRRGAASRVLARRALRRVVRLRFGPLRLGTQPPRISSMSETVFYLSQKECSHDLKKRPRFCG